MKKRSREMDSDVLRTGDLHELGHRLQAARRARGLTQQEAADHVGVARTTVTAIEKGERRIQPQELMRLATLYGRRVGEFLRQGEPVEAFVVQLRSAWAPTAVTEQEIGPASLDFQQLCEDYLELERICAAPPPQRYPTSYEIEHLIPETAAEDVAISERSRLGLGDGPLINLRQMLESDGGLRAFYIPMPSRIEEIFAYMVQPADVSTSIEAILKNGTAYRSPTATGAFLPTATVRRSARVDMSVCRSMNALPAPSPVRF